MLQCRPAVLHPDKVRSAIRYCRHDFTIATCAEPCVSCDIAIATCAEPCVSCDFVIATCAEPCVTCDFVIATCAEPFRRTAGTVCAGRGEARAAAIRHCDVRRTVPLHCRKGLRPTRRGVQRCDQALLPVHSLSLGNIRRCEAHFARDFWRTLPDIAEPHL